MIVVFAVVDGAFSPVDGGGVEWLQQPSRRPPSVHQLQI